MGLFTPSKEELEKAKNGGNERIAWEHGAEPTLLIKEFKEMPDKNLDIFVTTVVGGEHDGKEQALFFRTDNEYDVEAGIRLLTQFFTEEQLITKQASPVDMVGSQITCKVKLTKSKDGEKTYTNFNYFKKVDDAPVLKAVGDSDIPF